MKLLLLADPSKATPEVRKLLVEVTEAWQNCGEFSPRYYRFRVSIPPDEIVFNQEVAVDLLWL